MEMIWKRLVRIRLMSAIILALPGVFICVWYSSSAYLALRKYERAVHEKAPANVEFFQIHLFDILNRDLRWILSSGEAEKSKIETFVLEVGHNNMITMYGGAGQSTDRPYVPAKMSVNSNARAFDIEVRLRGSRHWHYLSRKKSMKIKVVDKRPYKGHRVFNLINQATPLVVGQKIVTDTAAENGVMVPPYEFVRVVLNGEDMGVFHFEAQPDDTLFRKNRTMYSDFFSGNLYGKGDAMTMWEDVKYWKKVTSRLHSNHQDVKRLKEFLTQITNASFKNFEAYAREYIDFEAFASFEAIDVVFGVEQHGFKENQKLYFDPYKGNWIPVAWDLRGFKHDGVINRVENPITIRLKMIPEYHALRNQKVWDLLNGAGSVNRIRKRAEKEIAKLMPELANDRLFSAYKQLPKVNEFAFKMLRPMNLDKLAMVLDSEMMSYERRHAFLMNQLQKSEFYYRLGNPTERRVPMPAAPEATADDAEEDPAEEEVVENDTDDLRTTQVEPASISGAEQGETSVDVEVRKKLAASETTSRYTTPLHVIVAGEAGIQLDKIRVSFKDCSAPDWTLRMDGDSVSDQNTNHLAYFDKEEFLMASVALTERVKGDQDLNLLKVQPVPTDYTFVIDSNCVPVAVELFGVHQITQNLVRALNAPEEIWSAIPKSYSSPDKVLIFKKGVLSTKAVARTERQTEIVQLGPGKVEIAGTQVFGEDVTVKVAPGTTFEFAKKASLIFKGKVFMEGKESRPIVFVGRNKKRWGGVALQGAGTSGSVLKHVIFSGGSYIKDQPVVYTSMLNIHNTRDILLESCTVQNNRGDGDAIHAAYVKDLDVRDIRVENVTMDAVDIEFCTGRVTRAWIRNVGDDGIDLMDSKIHISDSVILNCAQHGVSAGEGSSVQLTDFLVAWSQNGIYAKDSSVVNVGAGVLVDNQTGVRVGQPSGLYGGDVEVSANALYVIGTDETVARADRRKNRLDEGKIMFGFVDERPLRHLFADVLQISSGDDIRAWLQGRKVAQ